MSTVRSLIQTFEEDEGITLPKYIIVCPDCNGRGVHDVFYPDAVPNEFFDDDPDFGEDYRNGRYDRPCDECHGRNVIDAVDVDRLSPEMKTKWEAWVREDRETEAMYAAERRMGA